MLKPLSLLLLAMLTAAAGPCETKPMLASVGVLSLPGSDTTVKALASCYPKTGEAITTCRWSITKSGAAYPASDGLTALLQMTGQPLDSALFVVGASAVRAGLVGPMTTMSYWLTVPNAIPSGLDSLRIRVCGPPAC